MSRDDGFTVADRDVGLLSDPKVIRAYRRLGFAAVVAFEAVVDASWEAGYRVTLEEAMLRLPYDFGDWTAVTETLLAEGLIGDDGLVMDESWERWFRPAWERRENRRRSGAIGGARSWDKRRISDAEAAPKRSRSTLSSSAEPVRPSVRTDSLNEIVEVNAARAVSGTPAPTAPLSPSKTCEQCGHRLVAVPGQDGRWVCTNAPGHERAAATA